MKSKSFGDQREERRRRFHPMKSGAANWQSDFPIREEFEDFSGKRRMFAIHCHEGALGYTVRACEEGAEHLGYEFAAYSETSPYSALGRVREKARRGLATRHITGAAGSYQMLHDQLRGRITSDGDGVVVLVIDGIPVAIEELASLLQTHEGWEFGLEVVDALK
jgi:hypothetical protein